MRHARCGGCGSGDGGDDDNSRGGGDSFDVGMAVTAATAMATFDGVGGDDGNGDSSGGDDESSDSGDE